MTINQSIKRVLIGGILYLFNMSSALAASSSVINETITADVIIGLVGIVAVILVLGWLANYLKNNSKYAAQGKLKLISQLPVGVKERVAIIDVGGQHIVVGVTANSINKLHVLDDQERFSSSNDEHLKDKQKESNIIRIYFAIEWLIEKVSKCAARFNKNKLESPKSIASPAQVNCPEKPDFSDVISGCSNVISIKDKQ
ncbi:FliO/MopB family protein [Sessilibacter corallicola]|uniref:Flagellar protein n=1 Tax=Sessilibacter corallicola TaxID=2904075 RepID=A0ABQ0AAJ6_9GAMM